MVSVSLSGVLLISSCTMLLGFVALVLEKTVWVWAPYSMVLYLFYW